MANFGSEVRSVALRDVTGDGIPEALITLPPGNRSAPVEILQWDERQFHELGETNDSAEFIDLDHDGVPEIVERAAGDTNSCDGVTVMTFMQRFIKGKFTDATPPDLADIFTYTKVGNAPEDVEAYWIVSDTSPTTYRLRVINGQGSKVHRAKRLDLRLRDMSGGSDMVAPVRIELSDAEYDTIVNLPSRLYCRFDHRERSRQRCRGVGVRVGRRSRPPLI